MIDRYWFQKKWGTFEQTPVEALFKKIGDLESRVKSLEEENISTTNELYRLENSLDARIDILAEHCRIAEDV
jgi:regulator of replication initiation timing